MARKENNHTIITVTQYLDPQNWMWAASDVSGAALLSQDADAILAHLVGRLEADGREIVAAYAIIHDKDEREVWHSVRQELVMEPKPRHIHVVIKFASQAKSAPAAALAASLGVEPQYVEWPKGTGGGHVEHRDKKVSLSYDNLLSYLVHVKYPEKAQYDPAEVATVRGPDYLGVARERWAEWTKGQAYVVKKRAADGLEDLRAKVLTGEFVKQQIMLTNDLYEIYARFPREIDEALAVYGQRRAYLAAAKLRAGGFSTNVVFVHGPAGVGKTMFASNFIQAALGYAAQHGERWHVYRAATGNPLDDWQGEEVVLLDDLRASAMDANDWLLLLDPYNASPARARYRNKGEVAPRLIVITATIEPVEFFFYAKGKGDVDEALDQFIRRLASIVKVYRADDVTRYLLQTTGPVEPYTRIIEQTKQTNPGVAYGSKTGPAVLTLEYGARHEAEYSNPGAIAALMVDFSARSSDVPFQNAPDWPALKALAAAEEDACAERRLKTASAVEAAEALAAMERRDREARAAEKRLEEYAIAAEKSRVADILTAVNRRLVEDRASEDRRVAADLDAEMAKKGKALREAERLMLVAARAAKVPGAGADIMTKAEAASVNYRDAKSAADETSERILQYV